MKINSAELSATLDSINKNFPEFLRPKDLIKAGLFKSKTAISIAISKNQAPPFIRIATRVMVFPKAGLCHWLTQRASLNDLAEEQEAGECINV